MTGLLAMHDLIDRFGAGTSAKCQSCTRRRRDVPDHPIHYLWEIQVEAPSNGKVGEYIYACSFCDVQESDRH